MRREGGGERRREFVWLKALTTPLSSLSTLFLHKVASARKGEISSATEEEEAFLQQYRVYDDRGRKWGMKGEWRGGGGEKARGATHSFGEGESFWYVHRTNPILCLDPPAQGKWQKKSILLATIYRIRNAGKWTFSALLLYENVFWYERGQGQNCRRHFSSLWKVGRRIREGGRRRRKRRVQNEDRNRKNKT